MAKVLEVSSEFCHTIVFTFALIPFEKDIELPYSPTQLWVT